MQRCMLAYIEQEERAWKVLPDPTSAVAEERSQSCCANS